MVQCYEHKFLKYFLYSSFSQKCDQIMGDKETLSSLEVHLCPLLHHHISTIILTVIGSLNKLKKFHLITASFWGLGGYNVFILFKILRCYFQENIQYILRKHFSVSHLRHHNGDERKELINLILL